MRLVGCGNTSMSIELMLMGYVIIYSGEGGDWSV